jgi:hypothetical protein
MDSLIKCPQCSLDLPRTDFGRRGAWRTGCLSCNVLKRFNYRKFQQQRMNHRMRAFVQALKSESVCADCGQSPHYAAMEFDHAPGTDKLFCVSQFGMSANRNWTKLFAEIRKCEIVCANCHRARTFTRTPPPTARLTPTDFAQIADKLKEFHGV